MASRLNALNRGTKSKTLHLQEGSAHSQLVRSLSRGRGSEFDAQRCAPKSTFP